MGLPEPVTQLEAQPLREYLESVTGFSVPEDRWKNIAPRLLQRVALRNFANTRAYLRHLQEDAYGRHELEELLEVFTVRKTNFFRNPATFDVLAPGILPRLLASRGKGSPPPSIWSAGCSTGEEPYSIAMIARGLAPHDPRPCYILATDIVEAALRRARRGVYSAEVVREIPERFLPLLDATDGRAEVAEAVRAAVEYHAHNLVRDTYPRPASGSWDVIFCRNVIIYFGPEICRRVITRLWDVLAPGGALFLGHSEVLWGLEDRFDVVFAGETFYYRKKTPRFSILASKIEVPKVPAAVKDTKPASTAVISSAPVSPRPPKPASDSIEKTPSRGIALVMPFDLVAKAEASLATGDQDAAARTLRLAIARAPSWGPPRILLGRLYADKGENDRAIEELEFAAKIPPPDARVHLLLGMVRERRSERESAEDAYRHALYLEPD
ncbi:MAG: CheR family methyltransferase, partial [Planctomycetota bacterium]